MYIIFGEICDIVRYFIVKDIPLSGNCYYQSRIVLYNNDRECIQLNRKLIIFRWTFYGSKLQVYTSLDNEIKPIIK